jgi:uncharacterized protein (DUF1499 family)
MTEHAEQTPVQVRTHWSRVIAWLALWTGLVAVLLMLLAGPAYRVHLLGLRPAFSMMGLGAKGGIAAALIGLIGVIFGLVVQRRGHALVALAGLILGALAFVPPWMFMHKAQHVPPIHDISTDTVHPPVFKAVLALRSPTSNSATYAGAKIADQQHAAYPDIKPLQFNQTPEKVFAAALDTAHAMDWKIDASNPGSGRIEATATTLWFGFKDDVVIRIQADPSGSRLDIRSASRVGISDVGKNAARIRAFRKRMDKRLKPGH